MSELQVEQSQHQDSGKEKNRVELIVRHAGLRVTLNFNVHQKIQKVLDDALRAFADQFNLQPPANSTPILRFGENDLNPEQSIQDARIPDRAELDLRFNPRSG